MTARILVSGACRDRCPACTTCSASTRVASLEDALRRSEPSELVLGGGNALEWPHLEAFLAANRGRERPQKIWLEAPARALTEAALRDLGTSGAHGVVAFVETTGSTEREEGADTERVIECAEALGLAVSLRVTLLPGALGALRALAEQWSPRPIAVELAPADGRHPARGLSPAEVERLLLSHQNLRFGGSRDATRGYWPPCTMPRAWSVRPEIWRDTLRADAAPNRALDACSSCTLASRCRFTETEAIDDATRATLASVRGQVPWEARRRGDSVPPSIRARRPEAALVCVTPWTSMDLGFSGRVVQCCSSWTLGERGHFPQTSLAELWNGEGFRRARRLMSGEPVGELCLASCPRLFDRRFEEERFRILNGSERFVKNQLLLAEDIAARRDEVRGKPLELSVGASTYCNYDCIMCIHGRTPRVDLDERLWDELPGFLPTLRTLTLLGGEPLANPRVIRFFQEFDLEAWPDVTVDLVTNGSLLTSKVLERIPHSAFGDVTVSLNAGTPETYERVMRKGDFGQVLENLDALLHYRARQPRWFGISLSLVVQPETSADLVPFGQRAHERNLRIRLIPLDATGLDGLDFYRDGDAVARVLGGLDRLAAFADRVRPEWRPEVDAARQAIAREAASRDRPIALRARQ